MCILLTFSRLTLPLLVLATVVALAIPVNSSPRGMPIYKASLYKSGSDNSWICLNKEKAIAYTQINDDYCDCADGSDEPGTSACSNGRFNCANVGHRAEDIYSSRVNDGICDCCDGSDEWAETTVECQNTCHHLARDEEERRRMQADLIINGNAKRLELIATAKQMRSAREARNKELVERLKALETVKAEKEELKRMAEAAEAEALERQKQQRESNAAAAEVEKAFLKYDTNNDSFIDIGELIVDLTLDRDHNGNVTIEEANYFIDNQERLNLDSFRTLAWPKIKQFIMLTEDIFTPPFPEDGDHSQLQHDEIIEESVAVLESAEQNANLEDAKTDEQSVGNQNDSIASEASPQYDQETKHLIDLANDARYSYTEAEQSIREIESEIKLIRDINSKDYGPNEVFTALDGQCFTYEEREYEYTLCPFDQALQRQRSAGMETILGRWDQWSGDGEQKYEKQKYSHGAACWNGPKRSTIVEFKCSLEQKITSVTEPNRCEYNFVFETPAVCKAAVTTDTRQRDEL